MHNDGDFESNGQIICNRCPEWRHRRDLSEPDHGGNRRRICGRNAIIHEHSEDDQGMMILDGTIDLDQKMTV